MPEQLLGFWGAIAQIVPVLALALLIEARTLARRLTSDMTEFRRRAHRAGWALTYIVLATAMGYVEFLALMSLANGRSHDWEMWLAISVVMGSLYVVFSIPVMYLGGALLSDVVWIAGLRAPWGRAKRARRSAQRLLRRIDGSNLQLDARIAEMKSMLAVMQSRPDAENIMRSIHYDHLQHLGEESDKGRAARKYMERASAIFEDKEPSLAALSAAIEIAYDKRKRIESDVKTIVEDLDSIIERGAPDDDLDRMRQRISALAQN